MSINRWILCSQTAQRGDRSKLSYVASSAVLADAIRIAREGGSERGGAGGGGGKWEEEGRGGPALQASVEGPPTSALLVPCRERRGCYKELKTSENTTMHQNKEPPPPRAAREIKGADICHILF